MKAERSAPRLTCQDWLTVPASVMSPLYQAQIDEWGSQLEWDSSQDWHEVEKGRLLQTVSGLVVTDQNGSVAGWTYFLIHDATIQIGSFVSSSEACTTLLFDSIFNEPSMAGVGTVTFFALTTAPGVIQAARNRGLTVSRYWYLSRALTGSAQPGPPRDARQWRVEDAGATAALLARAYGPSDGSRPFAPHGTWEEWSTYVAQIVGARGCGELMTAASWCLQAGPGRLGAVALVSRVGPGTGHLIQLAVDPLFQRRGTGAALLEAACGSAARAGCRRMTLLVAGQNRTARALYEGAGFAPTASFVAAGTTEGAVQPRRLTSVALGDRLTTFR